MTTMFAPLTIVCVRPIERGGRMHLPGETLTVPQPEGASMIRCGFARPASASDDAPAKSIIGRLWSKVRP